MTGQLLSMCGQQIATAFVALTSKATTIKLTRQF